MKKRWLAAILAVCMFTGNIQGTGFFLKAQAAQTEQETEETKAEETEIEEPETEEEAAEEKTAEEAESKEPETEKIHEAEAEKQLQEDAEQKSSESSDPDPADPAEHSKQSETGAEVSDSDDTASAADPAQPQELQQTSEQDEENRNIQEEETAKKKEKKSDSGIIWKSAHAPLVQGGDMVAEHFSSEDPADKKSGSKYSRKPAMSALQKGSALTRAQAVEGLKAKFAEAFSAYAHNVDISDFELYRKDYTEDGLDGEAVITEAYQTAVSGEHFFITGDFKIGASEETGMIREVSIGYGKSFRKSAEPEDGSLPLPDTDAIKAAAKEFESAVAAARGVIEAGSNDLEKVLLLHDYLVTECTYDFGANNSSGYYPDEDYTAYGALVKGKAVCNGYAFAFSWLAKTQGIETYIMASESMDHAWNLVRLDGNWYHIDVTRDDPVFGKGVTYFGLNNADTSDEGYVSHQFFLKSDGEMRGAGYTKWAVQASSEAVPSASKSSSYSEYLFRKYPDGAYGKIGKKWYAGALADRKIYVSSSLKTADASAAYTDKGMLYAIAREKWVYFCRTDGLFAFDPASGKVLAVSLVDGKKQQISEMGIRSGRLVWILQSADGSIQHGEQSLSNLKTKEAQGWLTLADGSLKYFKKGKVLTGRQKISGSWYYLDKSTGIRQTGWIKDGSYRYYFDPESGKARTGWRVIGGKGYYFKTSNARALTGKRTVGGRKYTFSSKGVLKKSHGKALSGKYFFSKKGKPAKGWKKIGKNKYYFDKKTYRYKTGLVKIGKYYYYFTSKGVMKTGFLTINGKKYFFKPNGRMDTGWVETDDGGFRYLVKGKPVKGLQEIYGKEFYFDKNGNLKTGLVQLNGKYYYFLQNGGRAKDKYITLENADGTRKLAYFGSDGERVTGKKIISGHTWYLLANDGTLSAAEKRQAVTTMALSYLKTKQSSSAHHKLIDSYNSSSSTYKRKYKVTYSDQWCAAAVSAWGILSGMENLLLPECSCQYMIKNFKSIGRWQENDAYVPQMGDIVMYDWQDKGNGDNTSTPDHVGLVLQTYKDGGNTYFLVIEGNCRFNINTGNVLSSAEKKAGKDVDGVTYFRGVGIRTMKVNGRYIRGFCLPAY